MQAYVADREGDSKDQGKRGQYKVSIVSKKVRNDNFVRWSQEFQDATIANH